VILITTSRRPTNRIRTLCNELSRCIPGCIRVNRGKLSREGVAEKAVEIEADRVVIVDRWKGGPGKIRLFKVDGNLVAFPPVMHIRGVKLQREFGRFRVKPFRSLVLAKVADVEDSEIESLASALSSFFKFPAVSIEEAVSKDLNACMLISRDPSQRIRFTFLRLPSLEEVGPRITLLKLTWRLGE